MQVRSTIPREDILTGNIFLVMLRLGWPVMIATVLETIYSLADTFWLGRLSGDNGGNAVASLQVAFPLIWFFVAFAVGFAMSGTALVSQHTGADQKDKASLAAGQIMSLAIISGILIGALGLLVIPSIVPLITSLSDVIPLATIYMKVVFIGMPFMFITGAFRALCAAAGNTMIPMYVVLAANVINIVLDPFFIQGFGPVPPLGVMGAALVSAGSSALSAVVSIGILLRGSAGITCRPADFIPRLSWYKKILKIGLPAAIGYSAESFGFVLLTAIIGRLPDARTALGAYGVGSRVISFTFIAMAGLGQGLTTIIGQSLGANNVRRANSAAWKGIGILFIILMVETFGIVYFRYEIVSLFVPAEPDIIREGGDFFLYFGFAVPLFGVIRGINSAFNAAGNNIPVMIISFCRLWLFRLPFVYIFAVVFSLHAKGVWLGMSVSNLFTTFVAVLIFLKIDWKTKITEDAVVYLE